MTNQEIKANIDTNKQTHDYSQHTHGLLEVNSFGDKTKIPSISFSIEADSMTGWNIHINTQRSRKHSCRP